MQVLDATDPDRGPPWWQARHDFASGSNTSLVCVLVFACPWQSLHTMPRCASCAKKLAANHRRPSDVATGRLVGRATEGSVVATTRGGAVKPVGSVCSKSPADFANPAGKPCTVWQ